MQAATRWSRTIEDPNYTGSASGTLVITQASATITLGTLTQTYDASPKPVTSTTSPAGLGVTYTYNGASSPPLNAGSYEVAATINDPNYTGAGSGTLVIGKASGAIALSNLNPTYDGAPKPASVATTPAGLAISLTYDGNASAPVNAGSYAVAAMINDANYTGFTTGTLAVGKATAGIALGNLNSIYDGTAQPLGVTTAPAGLAVSVTYDGATTPPTNAGSYAIAVSVVDGNYAGFAGGTLSIAPAAQSITFPPFLPIPSVTPPSRSRRRRVPGFRWFIPS